MALKGKASSGGGGGDGDFELLDADTYEGRLACVVDLGEHDTNFGRKRQVLFVWELTGAPEKANGRPWIVSQRWTLSFAEKANLRKVLEGWRRKPYTDGDDIDPSRFVGQPWSIQIVHKQVGVKDGKPDMRANVGTVGPVPKAREKSVPALTVLPFTYDMDTGEGEADLKKADWLPYVYGEKVADLVQAGKRNLSLASDTKTGGSGAPVGGWAGHSAPAEERDIPF